MLSLWLFLGEREKWTGDYRAIGDRILKENDDLGGFFGLMKVPPKMEDEVIDINVTNVFMEMFLKQKFDRT